MKYKCVGSLNQDGTTIMNEGDIIVTEGDRLYNITTGLDYKGMTFDDVVGNLVSITDEPMYSNNTVTESVNSVFDKFKQITDIMADTFKRKNHDYGNSFEQSLDKFGLIASAVRIGDKMNRFESLTQKKAQVCGESIRDTLLDMANYAIMTIMWMDKNGNV